MWEETRKSGEERNQGKTQKSSVLQNRKGHEGQGQRYLIANLFQERLNIDAPTFAVLPSSQRERMDKHKIDNMVGTSEKMIRVFDLVSKIASTDSTVLILGESWYRQGTYSKGHPRKIQARPPSLCTGKLRGNT